MNTPSSQIFRASLFVLASSGFVSLLLIIAPQHREAFKYFYWIHVAIIALAWWGIWRSRKLRTTWQDALKSFWLNVPRWLLALALPVAILGAQAATSGALELGTLEDGTEIQRKSWYEQDGKFWVQENNNAPRELQHVEYERLLLLHNQVFASVWVLLSYLVALQWHYVWRREVASAA